MKNDASSSEARRSGNESTMNLHEQVPSSGTSEVVHIITPPGSRDNVIDPTTSYRNLLRSLSLFLPR